MIATLQDTAIVRDIVLSLLYLAILLALRMAARQLISKRSFEPEVERRYLIVVRNSSFIFMVFGLAMIWSSEIETVAVSLVAVAAALVIATREMILCLLGSLFRSTTQAYSVGDRIEVNALKGLVVDIDLLSTKVLELTQASVTKGSVGRVVTIPNSQLLTQTVFNESQVGNYLMHTVSYVMPQRNDWVGAEKAMLNVARDEVARYSSEMVKHARDFQRRFGLGVAVMNPRVRIQTPCHESVRIEIYLPVPIHERFEIEQKILRAGMTASTDTDNKKPG